MHRKPIFRTITREEFNNNSIRAPKRKKRKCYSPVQRPRMSPDEYKKYKENGYKAVYESEDEQEQEILNNKKTVKEHDMCDDDNEWGLEDSNKQEDEENFEGNYGDE